MHCGTCKPNTLYLLCKTLTKGVFVLFLSRTYRFKAGTGHMQMNEVEAVKTASQREQVEHLLLDKGQVYADVWKFGINTALRISDLLAISMDDVRHLDKARPELRIIEGKTGKARILTMNSGAQSVIDRRLADHAGDVWLFQSTSNRNRRDRLNNPQSITRRAVGRVFESVGQQVTPRVYLGTHSMRKTRGFAMHNAGRPIEEISKILNHANTAVTMRYIGLDADTVSRSYDELVL